MNSPGTASSNTLKNKALVLSLPKVATAVCAFCCAIWCLQLAINYKSIDKLSADIAPVYSLALAKGAQPDKQMLENYSESLVELSLAMPSEAQIPLLQAKLAAISTRQESLSEDELAANFIHSYLEQVYTLQPTHYQGFPIDVAYASLNDIAPEKLFDALRTRLPLAINEQEPQEIIGVYLIAHWLALPPDIQQLAMPVIESGLRQQPTRNILLHTMDLYNRVTPFYALSPNRATSEIMRNLAANVKPSND